MPVPGSDVVDAVALYPGIDPSGVADSTTGINQALSDAGSYASPRRVYLRAGIYKVTGPILLNSPAQVLLGSQGATQGTAGASLKYGTVLKADASWSTTLPAAGIITVISGDGTGNTELDRFAISDLWVNGSSAPANVDGIAVWGAMKAVSIERVGAQSCTGRGMAFYRNTNFSSSNFTTGLHLSTCLANSCGSDGFYYDGTDGTILDCHAQTCGTSGTGDGFYIKANNNALIRCRGDLSINGITIDAPGPSGGFLDGITLVGCGTQRNKQNGLNVINSSTTGQSSRDPVLAVGCSFGGDGVNGGSGGGGFAGVLVSGSNAVTLSNCDVLVHTEDVAGGCPQYAVATASSGSGPGVPDLVQASGGLWNAATALVHDAAPAFSLRIAPSVDGYAGAQYAGSSTTPAQPVQTAAYLGAVQQLYVAANAAVGATIPRTNVTTGTGTLTSGTLYVTAVGLQAGVTCSAATFYTNAAAKTGGTHGWYVLLDKNRKVLAVTADQTDAATVWGAASTAYPLSFTTPAITQYSGLFYVGVMVAESGGTMPTFSGATGLTGGVAGSATGVAILAGASSTGQTTPPNVGDTMGAITPNGNQVMYAVVS